MRKLALALLAALLLCVLSVPAALAAKEPEKIYVLLADKLGYDPSLLLEEVPTVEESGAEVKASLLKATYKSEYAKSATIKYYDNGAFEKLELENVACVDGKIARLEYWYEREFWSYGGWEDDELSVRYSPTGRLMEYSGWVTKDVYCRFDGFGVLSYVASNDDPELTPEQALQSDLPLPELVGDPFDCGFDSLAPAVTVYAQFPDLGIDLRSALDAVPEPGELALMGVEGIPYVVLEDADHVYTDVIFRFDGDFWTNAASHFFGNKTLEDVWLLGDAYQNDFSRKTILMTSVADEQGNRITAFWERTYDEEADAVSLEKLDRLIIRFPEANDHGFTSLEADLATGARTLRNASGDLTLSYDSPENVRCEANYDASGALTGYKYRAYDGQMVEYNARGVMIDRYSDSVMNDPRRRAFYPPLAIDGELAAAGAASGDPAALYPPLEVVGGDVTVPAPGPDSLAPDEKVFARLEDTGFDGADALLALVPEEPGFTVDGSVVTVADQGFDEIMIYGRAGEMRTFVQFEGVLEGDVWTIDCSDVDLQDGDFSVSWSTYDDEGNTTFLDWSLNGELTFVQVMLAQPDENGITGMTVSPEYGEIGVFTEYVEAFYDPDGNILSYNYYAKDGTYCMFNDSFRLEDVYSPDEW